MCVETGWGVMCTQSWILWRLGDHLELGLQEAERCTTWVLGTELLIAESHLSTLNMNFRTLVLSKKKKIF